jgi:ornithine carbamoyltransferase
MMDLQGAIEPILRLAISLKKQARQGTLPQLLRGKTVLAIYEKNSTRTRVSFEVGIQRLGGISVTLDGDSSQMARGESIEDTGAVLSRYADAIVYRADSHANAVALAGSATVPVINALTDIEHPCQILADWMTLMERWGTLKGKRLAYIGDGNNMCQSYLLGAAIMGLNIHVATPAPFAPDATIVEQAEVVARMNGSTVVVGTDVASAVAGANAVATDTWISMGDEAESELRHQAFAAFHIDEGLMSHGAKDALFMHCLPGHWGVEASHAVAHGPRSVIYDQAENRMWAQMALLVYLLNPSAA